MNNKFCSFFTSIVLLQSFILNNATYASSFDDSQNIVVPPGGYAWSIYTDSTECNDFKIINTLAPGPLTGFYNVLPDSAVSAVKLCGEWLRNDLEDKFTDILYEAVDDDIPVMPGFADVNGDGIDDLILSRDSAASRIFLAPDWVEIPDSGESIDLRRICDVNNDGYPDSASLSDVGVLTLASGDSVFMLAEGFEISGITSPALGDMEGDGLADLVVGTDSGNLLIYRNRGSIDVPCFLPFVSESSTAIPMNAGAFSSPAIYPVGDSMLVAAVGTQQSGLKIYSSDAGENFLSRRWTIDNVIRDGDSYLNISPVEVVPGGEIVLVCGTRNGVLYEIGPDTDSLRLLYLEPVPGTYPNLAVALVNDDEFPDLIAGTREGNVFYLPGNDGWFEGNWEKLNSLPEIYSGAPAAWKDGLVFGSRDGSIRYFLRDENGDWIDFTENSEFRNIDVGEYSTPDFADMNNDGTEDLIIGNARGSLTYFELVENGLGNAPLFVERFSWSFEPNGAVSDIRSYYSRYFAPYYVFRSPSGITQVNTFSQEIMDAEPQYRDEIAYCIANTPVEILRSMYENGDSDLFSVNASEIYEMADKLEYVHLTDSGDSTICQVKTENGWIKLSKDNYYRFVVQPRILFEVPARVNTEYWSTPRDTTRITLEEWLNHEPDSSAQIGLADGVFWRKFIPADGSGGRTLEERMMEAGTYEEAVVRVCNFQSHSQPGGLMTFGYLTNDLQPMVIYSKAYGSCGEQSILQTALSRAFFIPAYVVGCRGEDHQWNQYLDPVSERWNHWDINYGVSGIGNVWVSGEGVNHKGKTISTITAFGPDNEVWPVTNSVLVPPGSGYMPGDSGYTCTAPVTILVTDPMGEPVEGAMVLARSHWNNANSVSEFNYTDNSGLCTFQLGWEPNGGYTIDVISPFGSAGSSNIQFTEGEPCFITYTVPCTIPQKQTISLPQTDTLQDISVTDRLFPVPYYAGSLYSLSEDNGESSYRSPRWTHWRPTILPGGSVYMNAENFRDYRNGLHCKAVPFPFVPEPDDTCFCVLDNRNSLFTWREFGSPSENTWGNNSSYDVYSWLAEPSEYRNPAIIPCLTDRSSFDNEDELSWIRYYKGIELSQDDPEDPLSSGFIFGPFKVPGGERSLEIGSTGTQSGLDMDLFLFVDRNANRSVDDMSELAVKSTSPTSNESISLIEPDTTVAYWIYMQGWQVPEDGGSVDLGLSFKPELFDVHSISPTGYQDSQPEYFSFRTVSDTIETGDIYLLAGESKIYPVKEEDIWYIENPLNSTVLNTGTFGIFENTGELIDSLEWNICVDSIPPLLSYHSITVDSVNMNAVIKAVCTDDLSGIGEAVSSIDSLESKRLVLNEDSVWSCSMTLVPFAGQTISVGVSFVDSAGNKETENWDVSIPPRPEVLFESVYPSGTVYEHRPVLQVYTDFRDNLTGWSATLSISSGTFQEELNPFVVDGNIIQFRPDESLPDGTYTAVLRIIDQNNSLISEHLWDFTIAAMTSTY